MAMVEPKCVAEFMNNFFLQPPERDHAVLWEAIKGIGQPMGGDDCGDSFELGFSEDKGEYWNEEVHIHDGDLLLIGASIKADELSKQSSRIVLTAGGVEDPVDVQR